MYQSRTIPESRSGQRDHRAVSVPVTYREAQILAGDFPAIGSVTIRQCLEFEPMKEAIEILEWAESTPDPVRSLKEWAIENETGYHRPRDHRPSAEEEYERYLAFLKDRQRKALNHQEHSQARGHEGGQNLSREQLEELTYELYAPVYRAEMERIIPAAIPNILITATTPNSGSNATPATDVRRDTGGTTRT